MNKKILVTGVAGLLGSRLADWLIKNTEYKVIGIDDMSGGYIENVPDGDLAVRSVRFKVKSVPDKASASPLININRDARAVYKINFVAAYSLFLPPQIAIRR